jgi:subtilisin family serine protease
MPELHRSPDLQIDKPPRNAKQRKQRKDAVETQVGQLRKPIKAETEQKILDRLVEGRKNRRSVPRVEVLPGGEHGHRMLAATGTLLVRRRDLRPEDEANAQAIAGLDDLVLVPGDPADPPRASYRPNFVTPMGVVVKSVCGPEPAIEVVPPLPTASTVKRRVRVAVIDTGVNAKKRSDGWLQHLQTPDNVDRLYRDGPPILGLGAGHGTFVAGIIQRLAPGCDLRIYRALQEDGLGTEVEVALAMLQAVDEGADILNLSLGLETTGDLPPLALAHAVRQIRRLDRDVLIIAAAGNTAADRKVWPGAFQSVTAVAGLTVGWQPAPWSTHGSWVRCSTLGEGVLSTYVEGKEDEMLDTVSPDTFGHNPWALWSGTSFAAPQITGAVAHIAQRRDISPRAALDRLLKKDGGERVPDYGVPVRLLDPGDLDSADFAGRPGA